jgi:LCP family protein required for cell wall assembly
MRLRRAAVRMCRYLVILAIAAALIGLIFGVERVISLTRAWQSVERVSLSTEASSAHPDPDPWRREAPPSAEPAPEDGADQGSSFPHHGGEPPPSTDAAVPDADSSRTSPPGIQASADGTHQSTSTTSTTAGPDDTTTTTAATSTSTSTATSTTPPERPSVVALVGSDSRSGLDDRGDFGEFEGRRADVILLAIRDGGTVTLLSVPRDLHVADICHGGRHRIGEAFSACGDGHALANLVAELEGVTGVDVDHAAAVDLAGFQSVVDELGGYEICTDHALRDAKSGLDLEAGCTHADGATTLAWLRSRSTERRQDGHWEPVPAISDLHRNERQRRFIVDMFDRMATRSGPGAIHDALRSIAPHLTIDDQLSLGDAAAWAWSMRSADIRTAEIPVADHVTSGGAAVLVPTVDIPTFVDEST